jgi:hypothetical protein
MSWQTFRLLVNVINDPGHDTLCLLKVLADLQASGANVLRGLDPTTPAVGRQQPTTPATTLSVS